MIEKKFKDVTGFNDKNTFYQFDQWETQKLLGAKNRYIYDFSLPIVPGEEDDYLYNYLHLGQVPFYKEIAFTNLAPESRYGAYGRPGGVFDIIGTVNNEKTINNDEVTLSVNGDAMGFINEAYEGLFARQLAEYVDYFRSGYVEFAIKTNKSNCIVASGNAEVDADDLYGVFAVFGANMDQGAAISSLFKGDNLSPKNVASIDYPYYQATSFDGAFMNLNIGIKDKKVSIEYYDKYNRDKIDFNFIGNKIVADNEWHHVVVNFGRPGLIKDHSTKFNKKNIEIWIDGQLDKRFDDKINENQIFYPTVKWLFNNIKECSYDYMENILDIEINNDVRGFSTNGTIGNNEDINGRDFFTKAVATDFAKKQAFEGAIHLFAHGLNIPISQYEIKQRHRLWRKLIKNKARAYNVYAEMVNPVVASNKKRALKLYWNNLINNGTFGLELDDSFVVDSYSVTHQTSGSLSEIFNLDKSNNKSFNIIKNVRAVFTDNILVNGPGTVMFQNTEEGVGGGGTDLNALQTHPKLTSLDSVKASDLSGFKRFVGPRSDLTFSGLNLNNGDRILLTNQIKTEENGLWIFNGLDKYLTRTDDIISKDSNTINVVYVEEGFNSGTYWQLDYVFESFSDTQKWSLVNVETLYFLQCQPKYTSRWKNYYGEEKFINLEENLNINDYQLIVFMNYPKNNDEIFEIFPNNTKAEILKEYNIFLKSLQNVVANGANLYVSSPKLAEDLGIVKNFSYVDQLLESSDVQSASISPFEIGEPANKYFDTHRNNKYELATTITGLTNKETYILTDFINYNPDNNYDYEEYHAKYSYRQFGLQEGNEFFIPGLALRQVTLNDNLPGFVQNQRRTKPLAVVKPSDLIVGTVVTKLANTYYTGSAITNNIYDDYASTIIVYNNQILNGQPITGKIFVNCVEDAYTFSRKEYNKAIIQIVPTGDTNESIATRAWQYSTTRLNRAPQKINVAELTEFGQTTPTNGGGGPLIQAPTNCSNGIIRSETDRGNKDYQSDLYPKETEERYTTQEIPTLSMTWLGLEWLSE
jgi:hypothetical protein